jgi:CBS domain-containing protein
MGVIRKGSSSHLIKLQQKLRDNPLKTINTLLLPDRITYSVDLLKQYITTLGLRFVVFQQSGKFDGWIPASTFVAQLPEDRDTVEYAVLRDRIIGISKQTVSPNDSAKKVLGKMQELHIDFIPVVDTDQRWLFFANRGEILARLMTTIILEKQN